MNSNKMNVTVTVKSRADSAQQFARGFAFAMPALTVNSCGRFILQVEFWQYNEGHPAEFESEETLQGAALVEFCRFLGGCLLGIHQGKWWGLHQKEDRVLVTR